ncbi:MAG: hypothetical protein AVDCRST_MAG53-655, partial [uncultured Solirubrobacteraceae bacterium]
TFAGCGQSQGDSAARRTATTPAIAPSDAAAQGGISLPPQATTGPTGQQGVAGNATDATCDSEKGGTVIPAVEIPAVTSAPVVVPEQELAGTRVPGFTVPGVKIPAQRVGAQCAVEEPAPAGCLGRVVIPATTITAVTIPAATIPGVSVPGASTPAVTAPAQSSSVERAAAQTVEQECRLKAEPGEYQGSVYRAAAYRPAIYRPALYRPALYRPRVCVAGGGCLDGVRVDGVRVDGVRVDGVRVDGRRLDGRKLPEVKSRCVEVLSGGGSTAYGLCADVLFAFDRATVRPGAARVLREVAASIRKRSGDGEIRVEGHTDAKGSDAYNDDLSARRAAAVRRWLIDEGGFEASRVRARGFGEAQPKADNGTGDGRRKNRRVVIGVTDR